MSGRTEEVFRTFTLRWRVEVFIQDWKGHEGWGTLAKQPGVEGSSHGLILSLLVDHGLLLHPAQHARFAYSSPIRPLIPTAFSHPPRAEATRDNIHDDGTLLHHDEGSK